MLLETICWRVCQLSLAIARELLLDFARCRPNELWLYGVEQPFPIVGWLACTQDTRRTLCLAALSGMQTSIFFSRNFLESLRCAEHRTNRSAHPTLLGLPVIYRHPPKL